ncbi:MAG: GAF domain-containing protein [Phycisphaeraceae bacterium]|nr:GAF domain-containing protein [Phycisphaeraceae bacterium]
MPLRDYSSLLTSARSYRAGDRATSMRAFLDLTWSAFGDENPSSERKTISWIGFYERDHQDAAQMILIDRRPKPACSPIGLHGLCGKGMLESTSYIVDDVRTLGANYVACDPRDQSELVVPLIDEKGESFGVLDVDSFAITAFDEHDAAQMQQLLLHFGLTGRSTPPRIMRA